MDIKLSLVKEPLEMQKMYIQRKNDRWLFSHSSVKSSGFLVSNTLESKAKKS